MHESLIVEEFANAGYQISPDAIALIGASQSPSAAMEQVLQSLDDSVLVVSKEHLKLTAIAGDGDGNRRLDPHPEPPAVNILCDISNESTCVGEYREFVRYFRDRYTRLSGIIRGRIAARPIESLRAGSGRTGRGYDSISIIGMVSSVKTTANGNKLVQLEDPTGSFAVLARPADRDIWETACAIVQDEVIGVTGSLIGDGKLLIVSDIVLPDIPNHRNQMLPGSGNGNGTGIKTGKWNGNGNGNGYGLKTGSVGGNGNGSGNGAGESDCAERKRGWRE